MATTLPRRSTYIMPEFVRTTWVSQAAREAWAPRLEHVRSEIVRAEIASVEEGIRPSARIYCSPDTLDAHTVDWARQGLIFLPTKRENTDPIAYQTEMPPLDASRPWRYRGLLTRTAAPVALPETEAEWGAALGYPECCISFFEDVWVKARWKDVTWPAALQTQAPKAGEAQIAIDSWNLYANILWRWLGVRPVFHLPCSFNCAPTVALGEQIVALFDEAAQETIRTVLAWPVEWSALHGIGLLLTPIVRVCMSTDSVLQKHTVRLPSTTVPAEMPAGTIWPYRQRMGMALTETSAYRSAPLALETRETEWTDNGFASLETMRAAHGPLIQGIKASSAERVLDLGCGNGALLWGADVATPCGVEADADRCARATERVPDGEWLHANIFALTGEQLAAFQADLTLLSVRRLTEGKSPALTEYLADQAQVLCYSYDDDPDITTALAAGGLRIQDTIYRLNERTVTARLARI